LLLKASDESGVSEGSRPRVLIVDDREENRYVLCRSLERAGFGCTAVSSGIEALKIAQTLPDLIILDVHLPDISGYDVCQRIKKDPRTASISILQISASFVSSEDRVRALEGGADGYLTHPIDRLVLVATARSLLRLRRAETIARRSAEHWQATFDALAEGLALVDSNNRLIRWNSAFSNICRTKLVPHMGDDASVLFQGVLGSEAPFHLNGHSRRSAEISINRKTVQLSVSRIADGNGDGEKIIILTDITDRRLAEYALRTAEKLAATGKLANAIAHEINNPLEALTNLIYLANRTDALEDVQSLLSRAENELARISRITKQSLSFHRDTQVPVSVDLGNLIGDILDLFQRVASLHRVQLAYDRRSCPPIAAFPGQLSQVFGNLIRNAIEAAPPESTVQVRLRPIARNQHRGVSVTIVDRGAGIPNEIRQNIFDPFFTTKDLKGSGLGLWVSRSLILRHEGTIRFRTSQRAGSSGTLFEVFLPGRRSLVAPEADERPESEATTSEAVGT
jgi:signal transduction histidine kinase